MRSSMTPVEEESQAEVVVYNLEGYFEKETVTQFSSNNSNRA